MLSRRELLSLSIASFATGAIAQPPGDTKLHVTPQEFGAKAIGERYDDAPAIQRAVDYAWKSPRHNSVVFPSVDAFYNVRSPIICRPSVSMVGQGAKIKNLTREGFLQRSIFLPGNFHPDFTEKLSYLSLMPTNALNEFYLRDARDARRFSVGDQVFIRSTESDYTGPFEIPEYGWLNEVLEVSGVKIRFKYPVDVYKHEYGIAILRNAKAREDIPLFFFSDAEISGFIAETDGHWISDSATYNVTFKGNKIRSKSGIYGNTYQNTNWTRNIFSVKNAFSEQSHNSMGTYASDNLFIREADSSEVFVGFSFQEFGRNITFESNRAVVDRCEGKRGPMVWFLNVSGVKFSDAHIAIGSYGATSLVAFGRKGATATFRQANNSLVGCAFEAGECGRYVEVNGSDNSNIAGNYIEDCSFSGKTINNEAMRFSDNTSAFQIFSSKWNGSVAVKGTPPDIRSAR